MERIVTIVLLLAAAIAASLRSDFPVPPRQESIAPGSREPITPIVRAADLDAGKVALGRALFHEPRLSRDNTISCASCHDLGKGGADSRAYSIGIDQAHGTVNAPTVFNSALNFRQFWDGRAATLEEQVDGPIHHAAELRSTWSAVLEKLRAAPEYVAAFAKLYPDGIVPQNIRNAIAEFERSLATPDARFDNYLRGDATALTEEEKAGYRKFKELGCASCHQGVNVGGNIFAPLGALADYFGERGGVSQADYGRFNVTGREEDRFVFKVPGLRNVVRTAPYLHDGSVKRLEDAVRIMGRYQLGRELPAQDVEQIVKFLRTLTGEYEGKPL